MGVSDGMSVLRGWVGSTLGSSVGAAVGGLDAAMVIGSVLADDGSVATSDMSLRCRARTVAIASRIDSACVYALHVCMRVWVYV